MALDPAPPCTSRTSRLAATLAWAGAFAVAVLLGRSFRLEGSQLALVWPAAGVGVLWLLSAPDRRARLVALGVLAAVTAALNHLTGVGWAASLAFGGVNAAHAAVGAAALARGGVTSLRPLRTTTEAVVLLAAAAAASVTSAVTGALVAWQWLDTPFDAGTGLLLVRNGVSTVLVVGVVLALRGWRSALDGTDGPAGPVERVVLGAVVLLVSAGLLAALGDLPVAFAVLLVAGLAATRLGPCLTALLVAAQAVTVLVGLAQGRGPFSSAPGLGTHVLLAQSFVASLLLLGLWIALAEQQRTAALRASRATEERLRRTLECALVGHAELVLDADGAARVHAVNPALCQMLDRRPDELVGREWTCFVEPQDHALARRLVAELTAAQGADQGELRLHGRGGTLWAHAALAVLPGSDGGEQVLSAQFLDLTTRKLAEDRLAHEALHDELTALPNRRFWQQRAEQALASGDSVGVLFLDLDGFKAVNDEHGHATGDALLVEVARRLVDAVRPGDTVARTGGDEFVVLCPGVGEAELATVRERVQQRLAVPVLLGERRLPVAASVGLALAEAGSDVDAVVTAADASLYEDKRRRTAGRVPSPRPAREPEPAAR